MRDIVELDNNSTKVDSENDKLTSRQEVVSILSDLRSQYNCFDEHEEPVYHALSEAIQALREPERKVGKWVEGYEECICPFCDHRWSVIDNCTETFNFCPNCGAKLED